MVKTFKNKQKLISTLLLIITLITAISSTIIESANTYLTPTTASYVTFAVIIISAIGNQLATNYRVDIAEQLAIQNYSKTLGLPIKDEETEEDLINPEYFDQETE